jgi:hypothetical protein
VKVNILGNMNLASFSKRFAGGEKKNPTTDSLPGE